MALFKKLEVRKIVTLSPHAYNVFKNEYPTLGGDFQVTHYTQLLSDLIKHKKLKIASGAQSKITYHDPCFLGRYNDEYEAPRKVLSSVGSMKVVEMESSREHSFCCGGGGANFYTDMLGNAVNSPARTRAREASITGADILAVACPKCLTMLEDAVKAENLEGKLIVKDIAEIIAEVC